MTKILVECPQCIPSVRVGVLEPLEPLAAKGLCQVRYRDTKEITREDISWCDCLICVRGCEYPTLRIVEAAKAAGRFLIYFLDDHLLEIPRGNASTNYYSDYKIKVNLTKILSLCDVLWAVNRQILDQYGAWCPRCILSRVPAHIHRPPPQPREPVHVLYAGSVDHSGLVREKLTPAVVRILEDFPGQADFTFVGPDPGLKGVSGVSVHPFFEKFEDYQAFMANGGFSVGLAPAYDTPFYACKYYNKFVEYSSFGLAGLYENTQPYTQVVEDGKTGFLCGHSSEDWYAAIAAALASPEKVQVVAQAAQALLTEAFSPDMVSAELAELVPELVEFSALEVVAAEIPLPSMRWLFYQERLRLLCRMYGVLAVFVIPWKAVKKLGKLLKKRVRGE